MEIPKAVCLHEEDAGVLWKHMDYRTGQLHQHSPVYDVHICLRTHFICDSMLSASPVH